MRGGIPIPGDPHLRRWMLFVDGENLTIRAQAFASANNISLKSGPSFMRNVFVWLPGFQAGFAMTNTDGAPLQVQRSAIRSFYYTSLTGDEEKLNSVRYSLHELGFHAEVLKRKVKGQSAKGVDIALARDLLSHAFHDNYDVAVLVAGDGDFVPLVEEVKRLGKVVYVAFFVGADFGLSPELDLASDRLFAINDSFLKTWADSDE